MLAVVVFAVLATSHQRHTALVLEGIILALVVEGALCYAVVLDCVLTEGRALWPSVVLHEVQQ